MKRFYNYTFNMVCIYIIMLSIACISNFEIKTSNHILHNINLDKIVASDSLIKNETNEDESINLTEDIKEKENSTKIDKETEDDISTIDTSLNKVLSTENVNISHYGHDCYGCTTGKTASGYYVGDGRIHYQDENYGSVRVVAADKKYPLGTIIRLSYDDDSIIAIVLDRGGAIGDNKKFQIDLLAPSNSEALMLGTIKNASLEVLRLGY